MCQPNRLFFVHAAEIQNFLQCDVIGTQWFISETDAGACVGICVQVASVLIHCYNSSSVCQPFVCVFFTVLLKSICTTFICGLWDSPSDKTDQHHTHTEICYCALASPYLLVVYQQSEFITCSSAVISVTQTTQG